MSISDQQYGTNGMESVGSHEKSFCDLLKLLSNPNRLRILLFLKTGEYAVGEIETALELKQPNLSHELRKLREHGIVNTRRQSKVIFYSITDPSILRFLDGLVKLRETLQKPISTSPRMVEKTVSGASPCRDLPARQGECGQFAVVHHLNATN